MFTASKKMNINKQDKRGGSPLHWACSSNAEMALGYILALGPDPNIQDVDGYTPLHLAVKNIDQVLTTRFIRYLLLKGARTDLKDRRGKLPIDYTQDIKCS